MQNESRRSEMLAAACAVGVAGTFAAPIGGKIYHLFLSIPTYQDTGLAKAQAVTFVQDVYVCVCVCVCVMCDVYIIYHAGTCCLAASLLTFIICYIIKQRNDSVYFNLHVFCLCHSTL